MRSKSRTDQRANAWNGLERLSGPSGERAAFQSFEPLVVADRVAPHVSTRGSGHLALANVVQARRASVGTGHTLFVFHAGVFAPISLSDS